jgi:membrane-associated phospholipid phosphatase
MIEFIFEVDRILFEFFNGKLHTAWLDYLMPIITNANTWIPLYAGMVIYFIIKYKKLFFIPVLGVLMSFASADLISARVIKPMVQRTRPCNQTTVTSRIVGVECRNSFGFPSSHASNHFAIALFMIVLSGTRKRIGLSFWLVWAILVSYSRIYVGVHFPLDIFGGMLLGSTLGIIFARFANHFLNKFS